MSNSVRIGKWDNVKGALIFLVVLGHVLNLYTSDFKDARIMFLLISTFHMPLFLFVSGLFSKKTVREKNYKKVVPFLVLYFFIIIIRRVTMIIAKQEFTTHFFTDDGAQWYCLVLFYYYLITIALRNVNKKYVMICSITLACFIGYDPSIGDFLTLSRTIVFFPFFYLGYCFEPESLEKAFLNIWIRISAAAVLVISVLIVCAQGDEIYWIRPLLTGRNPFSSLGEEYADYGGLIRFCYYFVSALVSACFIAIIPNKSKILTLTGNRSLQIYALHFVVLMLLVHKADMINVLAELCPAYHMWLSIPVTIAIALFCSIKIFGVPFDYIRRNGIPKSKENSDTRY
ncbi:MAG: acyltransferase family protein [Lachnospiraceae bacterium]|nr:acyltransferase family protein [Lachnospiraceae bacterium]